MLWALRCQGGPLCCRLLWLAAKVASLFIVWEYDSLVGFPALTLHAEEPAKLTSSSRGGQWQRSEIRNTYSYLKTDKFELKNAFIELTRMLFSIVYFNVVERGNLISV